jgi:hypothetical protein
MPDIHLLKVLFGTNLVSNTSTNASKGAELMHIIFYGSVSPPPLHNVLIFERIFSPYSDTIYI